MIEFHSHDILNRQNSTERTVIDRRFNEMKRQIGELTDLVLALTQQISSNPREGNEINTVTTNANSRSVTPCLVIKIGTPNEFANISKTVKVSKIQTKINYTGM